MWQVASLATFASILVHGITTTPFTQWYVRSDPELPAMVMTRVRSKGIPTLNFNLSARVAATPAMGIAIRFGPSKIGARMVRVADVGAT